MITRSLLFAALVLAGVGAVQGSFGAPLWWLVGGSLLGSVGVGWVAGGLETLVVQGNTLTHRRFGPIRGGRRVVPIVELRRVTVQGGLRLETSRGAWIVARRLPAAQVASLAEALERHLGIGARDFVAGLDADGERLASPVASRPVRSDSSALLRHRNPPPR